MEEIAIGVTVFQREKKIANLLDSIDGDSPVNAVYIGDNGKITETKKKLYSREYPFDLIVLDLKYDAGLGYSRHKLVQESKEPYLLIVDNDVTIPRNILNLYKILNARDDIGGVGGVLIEDGRIRSDVHDLYENRSVLVKDIHEPKSIQSVAGRPFVEFDQIQNVAMYQRECLEDYTWDPEYTIGWEHTDFFVGHMNQTDWKFGVAPNVMFRHYPGGSNDYLSDRKGKERIQESKEYFLDKWGYDQVVNGQVNWLQTNAGLPSKQYLTEQFIKRGIIGLPPTIQAAIMDLRDKIRRLQGKPPA